MAKKPSFFERLTGASWTEEEPDSPAEKKPVKTKKIKKDKPIKTMPTKEKKPASAPKKESEDWLAESEGQLTIDVYQTPNEIVIKSTIAGVKPEDIDISITNDMITINNQ